MKNLLAKQITLTIGNGNKILCQNLSLDIPPGKIWGVLGPNGSGKTTLLHALAGLHPLTQGEIFLHGRPLKNFSGKMLAQEIGILFQHFNDTMPQTIWEYCLAARYPHLPYFGRESQQDQQIVLAALQRMELAAFMRMTPAQLSGGEKRRLAIASIIAQNPSVYLLDEPANHLDVRHQSMVMKYFRGLALSQHKSVVMSLHDVNHAQQFCDRVLLLFADGSVLQGDTRDILTEGNLSRLYGHAMGMVRGEGGCYWVAL